MGPSVRARRCDLKASRVKSVSRVRARASRRHDHVSRCVRGWTTEPDLGIVCLEHLVTAATELYVRARIRELEAGESESRSVSRVRAHAPRRHDLVSRGVRSWITVLDPGTVCLEQVVMSTTELSVRVRIRELEAGESERRSVSRAGAGASRRHVHVSRRVRGWTAVLNPGRFCLEHLETSTTGPSVRARTRELEAGGSDPRRRVR